VNGFADKLTTLERQLSAEYGGFNLFAMMVRKDGSGSYDLVVSAPWLSAASKDDLDLVVNRVKETLTNPEFLKLTAVFVLDPTNHMVEAVNNGIRQEHNLGIVYKNMTIKTDKATVVFDHAIIVTSMKSPTPKEKQKRT
jgi:hypothetical protein